MGCKWLKIRCLYCIVLTMKSVLRDELQVFTKNFQLDLQGLLSSAVPGNTPVSALVGQGDLLDPEGRRVLDPDRKSIVKPAELRARLSLDHTWQSHALANQGFQEGRCWLDSGLGWKRKIVNQCLTTSLKHVVFFLVQGSHGIDQFDSIL